MGASVVAGVDASSLEPTERVFDLVPLAIQNAVMFDRLFTVGLGWDTCRDAAHGKRLAEPVGVVALVAEQLLRGRQRIDHQCSPLVIAHLAFAEQQDDGTSLAIAYGVQLRVQTALGAPEVHRHSAFPGEIRHMGSAMTPRPMNPIALVMPALTPAP